MSATRESSVDNTKTNLIVNYLPQGMTDEQFRVLFAKHGDIRSARIIRNKTTGYSYGFGFVDYFNTDDAERAIESLNGSVVNKKTIKVAYARPSGEDIKNANLYVSGLPNGIDNGKLWGEKEVINLFAKYGEIIQCRLLKQRPGSAFVLFNLHEEAQNAMSALNNTLIPSTSCRISVKFATEKKFVKSERNNNYNGNGNGHSISYASKPTKRTYSDHNGQYNSHFSNNKYYAQEHKSPSGPIRNTSHNNRYNPMSQQTPPFYHHHHHHHTPPPPDMGPPMYPPSSMPYNQPYVKMNDYYQPPPQNRFNGNGHDNSEHILFVYNIGPDTTEDNLGDLFANYGTVLRTNVIRRGYAGESRGYGFVTMKSFHQALNAIQSLNGHKYSGSKPLQVSFKKM